MYDASVKRIPMIFLLCYYCFESNYILSYFHSKLFIARQQMYKGFMLGKNLSSQQQALDVQRVSALW